MKLYYTGLFIFSALPAVCQAAPPIITAISPRGVERGKPVEITITGTNLTPETKLWASFEGEIKRIPEMKPTPTQAKFLVTTSRETPIGFFLVRAYGPEGASAPSAMAVDPFPGLPEKEDNNTQEKAQVVPLPVVIDGQCAGGDQDYFRFSAKKGQHVVIETEAARLGTAIVPQLRLTDAKGRFLASDDKQRLRGDARLVFTVPADGDYVIEMSDSRYRGGNPPQYRLKIGEYDVIEEVFPLGFKHDLASRFTWFTGTPEKEWHWNALLHRPGQAFYSPRGVRLEPPMGWREGMAWPEVEAGMLKHLNLSESRGLGDPKKGVPLELPTTVASRLEKASQVHRFVLKVKEEQKLRFAMQAQSLGSYLDGQLRVLDDKGKLLAQADDVDLPPLPGQPPTKSLDPFLEFTAPKGVASIVLEVRDGLNRGGVNFGYLLTVESATPDFQLRLLASEVNVPLGGFGVLPVAVVRRGYDGPIQLEARDLPPGWGVLGGFIPAKATAGSLLFRNGSAPGKSGGITFLSVLGKALDGPGSDTAECRLVLGKDVNPAVSFVLLDKFALASDLASPLRMEGPSTVDLVMGIPRSLPVTLAWEKESKEKPAAVEISSFGLGDGGKPLPGGVTVKSDSVAPGAKSGNLVLLAPTTMPDGRTHDLILQAKTKLAGKDVTVLGPLVTVQVHRPFEIVLEEKHALKPGQAVVLKGTLKRHETFRDPIQLKLDGLPPGVTAMPIKPVPGDQKEFQIELKVDAKAALVMSNPTLTAMSTIGGMAYTHPPRKLRVEVIP